MWIEKQHAYGYRDIEAASIVFFSIYHLMFHSLESWNQLVTCFLHLLIFFFRKHDYLPSSYFFLHWNWRDRDFDGLIPSRFSPPNISISLFTHHSPIFPFNSPFKPSKCPSISPYVSFFQLLYFSLWGWKPG